MENLIKVKKLKKGNFSIELSEEQLDRLATYYLLRASEMAVKGFNESGMIAESYARISEEAHGNYLAIRNVLPLK